MYLNTVLAVIIILLFILFFVIWFSLAILAGLTAPTDNVKFILSGAIFFGFWFLIAYRLYNCPPPGQKSEITTS